MSCSNEMNLKIWVVPTGEGIISAFLNQPCCQPEEWLSFNFLSLASQEKETEREKLQGGSPYETLPELLDMVHHPDRLTERQTGRERQELQGANPWETPQKPLIKLQLADR